MLEAQERVESLSGLVTIYDEAMSRLDVLRFGVGNDGVFPAVYCRLYNLGDFLKRKRFVNGSVFEVWNFRGVGVPDIENGLPPSFTVLRNVSHPLSDEDVILLKEFIEASENMLMARIRFIEGKPNTPVVNNPFDGMDPVAVAAAANAVLR